MAFAGLWEGFKWPDGTVHVNVHHHHHERQCEDAKSYTTECR